MCELNDNDPRQEMLIHETLHDYLNTCHRFSDMNSKLVVINDFYNYLIKLPKFVATNEKFRNASKMKINEIKEILAKPHENTLDVHYYRSNYGADKTWVAGIKNETFKYPVVYSINKNNELSLKYSLKNTNGHFGLPKFIFSNGAGFYCDLSGEYGLTQWAYCIYDEPEKLIHIEKMFRNENFKKIIRAIHLDSSSYNINIMKLFKKNIHELF
jgi:hypothetical protein